MAKETTKFTIGFNKAATAAFVAKESRAHRFRMEVRDGSIFVKPTWRMAGPHVFADFIREGEDSGITIELDQAQLEKLGVNLKAGAKFGVQGDRYGWFGLVNGEGIEGAEAVVQKVQ